MSQRLLERWSVWMSYVLHPVVILWLCMWLASFWERQHVGLALVDALILVAMLLPGLIYIGWMYRRGSVGHPHLLLKEERRIVLPLLVLGLLAAWGVYSLIEAPTAIRDGLMIGVIEGVVVIGITRFWKISLHASVSMACAALFVPINLWLASGLAVLALITGFARLPIRHHTLAQVVVGWIYGFGMTLLLLWLFTNQI